MKGQQRYKKETKIRQNYGNYSKIATGQKNDRRYLQDNTWKEYICSDCVDLAGHCPMRFLNNRSWVGYINNKNYQNHDIQQQDKDHYGVDVCLCHRE
uniref:4Fe-4S Wbl-type domain-containing protein n=1 Tax=Meloidogyne hapla TaxID=6305 RepID=A0A1I8BQT2_MELHA